MKASVVINVIEKTVVVKEEVKEYVLRLTEYEATVLRFIMRRIAGEYKPGHPRMVSEDIEGFLNMNGVPSGNELFQTECGYNAIHLSNL